MSSRRFSLETAREAAVGDRLALWVGDFLASRGSDNAALAAGLAQERTWWLGPLRVPLADLVQLAGPEEEDVLIPIEPDEWEHDVEQMEESVEQGWEPPPLILEYQDGRLLIQDGNHRFEALQRAEETTGVGDRVVHGEGRPRPLPRGAPGGRRVASSAVADRQGLELHGTTEAVEAFDRALDHQLRFQIEMVSEVGAALAADPTFVMGHVLLTYMTLMSTDGADLLTGAREIAATVDRLAGEIDLSPREQAHVAVVDRWVGGDMIGAGRLLDDLLLEHPQDVAALAVGHQIDFFTGDAVNLRDRVARALPAWSDDDPRVGFVRGMYSFGLEECHRYEQAEAVGREALEHNPDDVWGIHAVVHTFEMRGLVPDGLRFMQERRGDWADGNFLNVHNSWHNALFLLQGDDLDGALAIYDRVLHHEKSEPIALELLDATALLWRLHLEDQPVGDRWDALAEAWEQTLVPGVYPFNDMHAVMTYVGGGDLDRARGVVDALEQLVAGGVDPSSSGAVMTEAVGLPVCRGLVRFAEADYDGCIAELLPRRRGLQVFGGSNAQRDAVARTLVEAARRSGNSTLALALLAERRGPADFSTYDWAKRAQVLRDAGDPAGAADAEARAAELRAQVQEAIA